MKNEARSLTRCRMAGIRAPCVYDVDFYSSEIIMEKIENSTTVRNLIRQYVVQGRCFAESNGAAAESRLLTTLMMNLAAKIGRVLSKMHQNHIIHGDLTTSNMLVCEPYDNSDIYMIDFGLSSMDEKVEEKAVDLYVLEKAVLNGHPGTENFITTMLQEYEKMGGKTAADVIVKLEDVRLRGRKRLCFG